MSKAIDAEKLRWLVEKLAWLVNRDRGAEIRDLYREILSLGSRIGQLEQSGNDSVQLKRLRRRLERVKEALVRAGERREQLLQHFPEDVFVARSD